MMELRRTPKQYAELIYRNFCEDDWGNCELAIAWMNYQEKHGAIHINDEVDKITQAAILHGIEALLIMLQNEQNHLTLAQDLPRLQPVAHTPLLPNL